MSKINKAHLIQAYQSLKLSIEAVADVNSSFNYEDASKRVSRLLMPFFQNVLSWFIRLLLNSYKCPQRTEQRCLCLCVRWVEERFVTCKSRLVYKNA